MAKTLEKPFDKEDVNFEDILEQLGGFGKFQVIILVLVLIYEIPAAFIAFIPIFVGGGTGDWACGNESVSYEEICNCTSDLRSSPTKSTIVAEWGLVCESAWVGDFIISLQMCGMLFGNIVPPQLSDWYGRKICFVGLAIVMGGGQALSAIAPNAYVYGAARFLAGAGMAGYFSLNGIYTMEFLTPKWRQLGGCLGPLGEGVMILALLAYFIKQWRSLMWATSLPLLSIILIAPFVPESPRWLLRQKRVVESEKVLAYMARINGRRRVGHSLIKAVAAQEGTEGDIRFSYLDLFRRKELRGKTMIFIGIWFCWSFTYFGLSYNVKNLRGDPYFITFLMGLADAIGFRVALLVNNRFGRRKALILFTAFSAVFFMTIAGFQYMVTSLASYSNLILLFILFGKLGVAGGRSSIRCLTVESYPTTIRTMGFGVSRIAATFGGILAPQIAFIGSSMPSVPMLAFGILSIGGSLLSLLLSETSGKPLEEGTGPSKPGKIAPGPHELRYQLKSARPPTALNLSRALSI